MVNRSVVLAVCCFVLPVVLFNILSFLFIVIYLCFSVFLFILAVSGLPDTVHLFLHHLSLSFLGRAVSSPLFLSHSCAVFFPLNPGSPCCGIDFLSSPAAPHSIPKPPECFISILINYLECNYFVEKLDINSIKNNSAHPSFPGNGF